MLGNNKYSYPVIYGCQAVIAGNITIKGMHIQELRMHIIIQRRRKKWI